MSITATPFSLCLSVKTALAAAMTDGTNLSAWTSAFSVAFFRFSQFGVKAEITFARISRRAPDIPTGSLIPPWPSIAYSKGTTSRTSRLAGMRPVTATSSTRSKSASFISYSEVEPTAIIPSVLVDKTWEPLTET